jgi:NADPH:quinone reductase-like Zn-dependent oxidoreductase
MSINERTTMNAIGVFEFGGPEKLTRVELPSRAPGPGEVRLRVHAAAVNPTDALFRRGSQAARLAGRTPPFVPGMDLAGVIDGLGVGTDARFAIGDAVVALVVPWGPHGGAYAEQVVVPAASVVAAPKGVNLFAASTLLLNAATARVALDMLALPRGATVAITGAPGAVGGYAIELARGDGLRVIADAGSPADEAQVRSLGADRVVARGEHIADHVRATVPEGVAGLIDGAHQNALVLGAIADGGALATLRGFSGPSAREIAIHAVAITAQAQNTVLLARMVQLADEKRLTLRVADVLPAARAAEAHRRLEAGGVRGRLVLDFATSRLE